MSTACVSSATASTSRVKDEDLENLPFVRPEPGSPEYKYLHERRNALGGFVPQRRQQSFSIPTPPLDTLKAILDGSGDREISTTMAFVRILAQLVKDKELGQRIVPIIPDEARTFGMEGHVPSARHLLLGRPAVRAGR
jgi:pyruvate dehydrogenase E1 component